MHLQAFADHARLQLAIEHREGDLDAAEQVAVHPVGAGQIDDFLAAGMEVVDAVMLQEAPDERAHADVFRQPRHAGPERAHAAHDQVDLDARARGLVELVDDGRLQQRVHLADDARALAGAGGARFRADVLDQVGMHRERRVPQVVQLHLGAGAGQQLEHVVDVFADGFVGRHQAEVGIEPGGLRVVVAGAEMRIAAQLDGLGLAAGGLAAHHQQHLGVAFVADHAVHHVGAGRFELVGPVDVGLFVEARQQLDHHRHFLAVAGGLDQRLHHRGFVAGAVHGLLDGDHVRIARGLLQQLQHGHEALVRVVHQDVALADGIEDARRRGHGLHGGGRMRRVLQHRAVHQVGHLQQAHQVHRPLDAVAVGFGQAEFLLQPARQRGRDVVRDLQPHRIAEVPGRQFALQRFAQVGDFVFGDEQVGVARDAELVAAMHVDLRKQLVHEALHERRQQHEAVRIPRQLRRHLH